PKVAGERCRFGRNALHQAAIAAYRINLVVEDRKAGPGVAIRQPFLRDRHADAGRDALAKRAGGGFHTRDPVVLGMTARLAIELTEPADIVESHGRVPQVLVIAVYSLSAREVK